MSDGSMQEITRCVIKIKKKTVRRGHALPSNWKHGTMPSKSNGQLLSRHCPINTCYVTAQEMPTTSTAAALSKSLPTILF